MRLFQKLSSYRGLESSERLILRVAFRLLVVTRAALLVRDVPRWRTRLASLATRSGIVLTRREDDAAAARRTARLVETAAAYIWPSPSCLHRSLVLESMLHAQGLSGDVRFGIRRRAGLVEAHAWVEHDGLAITPAGDEHTPYAQFAALRRGA